MKLPKIKLHIQILIGLALGAVFGGIFHVDSYKLLITHAVDGAERTATVEHWQSLKLVTMAKSTTFGQNDQAQIVKIAEKRIAKNDRITVEVKTAEGDVRTFAGVTKVAKENTIAVAIKPLGDLFINLLMMIAIPLVFASLLIGVASLQDFKKMARIGSKTIAIYVVTTAMAITIGLAMGNIIQPGKQMPSESKEALIAAYEEDAAENIERKVEIDFLDYLVSMVPKNPFKAMVEMEMLQIIFFALMFGFVTIMLPAEKRDRIIGFFDAVTDAMIKMVDIIMLYAPIGVFALISATIGEFGFGVLETLVWYIVAVVGGLALHGLVVYTGLLKILTKKFSIMNFFKKLRPAQLVAFTTSSSAATLPVTYECCENLGAPNSITSFVLPLGATINMDGTALYQGVAAVFIAQVYGLDLDLSQQLTVVLTATLASIGTAPIPGVGIVMLVIILKSVGIPEEGIALILGVDRILDMCRTAVNVTGDSAVTMIVTSTENAFEQPETAEPNAA
ncbi:MAG: dicarboxylate/amino acid:cation symporter [Ectothiorhodospiraceae bacterium]|nr:dicarboxylate/amino acid:cation symporter [Ectothiorhodospiraceae bacterium]